MKKRILVISWYFPPINSSEGLVTYKLLKNSKYKYDIFTQKENDMWSYTKTELEYSDNMQCFYSPYKELEMFEEAALDYYQKNMDKYDIIMTRSMPEESHKIGLAIKEINPQIKWIASFGDPIGNNPFTLMSLKNANPHSLSNRYIRHMGFREMISIKRIIKSFLYRRRIKKEYHLFIEKPNKLQYQIINSCDKVIYNNKYQKDYMLKEYNNMDELEKKTIILPHSFDEQLYQAKKSKNSKIVFTFIGHLDDIRSPHCLFKAIKELKKFDKKLADKVVFDFYGNLSDKDKLYLLNSQLLDVVNIKQSVDYIESLKIMSNSDWLIQIDANISDIIDHNIFFAAKLADYLGAKQKIIGITMLDGASADILRQNNALVVSNCVNDILNYLYLIIYENYEVHMNKETRKIYSSSNVSKIFDDEISKI